MSFSPRSAAVLVSLVAALLCACAATVQAASLGREIEEARAMAGVVDPPRKLHPTPNGELRLDRSELLASNSGQQVKFTVQLERAVDASALLVELPRDWTEVPESGIRPSKLPRIGQAAGAKAKLERSGRTVELAITQAASAATASFSIEDVGIPAGKYRLPFSWRYASGKVRKAGTATVIFYAPELEAVQETEGEKNPWVLSAVNGVFDNVSEDDEETSEPFVVITPGNPNRIAMGANGDGSSYDGRTVRITSNGGRTWRTSIMPNEADAPGTPESEPYHEVCCDPAFAADTLGNIWYSAITNGPDAAGNGQPARILVNRIAAGEERFHPLSVGLPARTASLQDKQMMTLDNTPTSPTYGRLYVVWDETSDDGNQIVISQCDTRPSGILNAAHCDDADNWSYPAPVRNPAGGKSVIYADVAVGPTGRVYVTWWNYSATNAIQGTSCQPANRAATTCISQVFSGWATPTTIALLDKTGGRPLPFSCPTLIRPNGRAGSSPSVEVDTSGLDHHGRVYVSWSDLRTGSGTTRCGFGVAPAATHLSWDNFVASRAGGLPNSGAASPVAGTRTMISSAKAEDIMPWLSVDQVTGQAWVDGYSSSTDANRAAAHFFLRGATPRPAGGTALGFNQRASAAMTNYSSGLEPNDHGDYVGLDATSGLAFPAFTDNSTGDGEIGTYRPSGAPRPPGGELAQLADAAGCVSQAGDLGCAQGNVPGDSRYAQMAVSANSKHVYAVFGTSSTDYGVVSYSRNLATGQLTEIGCITETGTDGHDAPGGCANGKALYQPSSLALSPDGRFVYVGGRAAVAVLNRNTTTGALTQSDTTSGCVSKDGLDTYNADMPGFDEFEVKVCQTGMRGITSFEGPERVRLSRDGKHLYVHNNPPISNGQLAAFTRNATTGALTQLAGAAGCMTANGSDGAGGTCTTVPLLADNGLEEMALSADGKHAYVAGYRDLMLFTRNTTTGALAIHPEVACLNGDGGRGCVPVAGMETADNVRVSPDDKHVYVLSDTGDGVLSLLNRTATGKLVQPAAGQFRCLVGENYNTVPSDDHEAGCVELLGMDEPNNFEISPDGGSVHVGQDQGLGIVNLDRDRVTGALSAVAAPHFCHSHTGKNTAFDSVVGDCEILRAGWDTRALAITPDGKSLYGASIGSRAITVLARRATVAPPYCTTFRATVAKDQAKRIRLLCNDENQNDLTYSVLTEPGAGSLGAVDQAKDAVLYTPPAGFVGTTSFTYRATDATGAAVAATVYVAVG